MVGRQWKEVSKGNLNPDVCIEVNPHKISHPRPSSHHTLEL